MLVGAGVGATSATIFGGVIVAGAGVGFGLFSGTLFAGGSIGDAFKAGIKGAVGGVTAGLTLV